MAEDSYTKGGNRDYPVSMYSYRRRLTREIAFGDITLGAYQPIRVESMTNTHTMDTEATVEQCRRLHEAGCEIIRMTVPTQKDAENLEQIRNRLRADGIRTPLVADIHFSARAAMKAVEFVDNIRINPGNYANKTKFSNERYTGEEYREELEKVRLEFTPLVRKAKELGVSMRIGTNHGSLSDRIVSRFGNSPEGMVEAALEFARICEDEAYYDVLFSMKSSNVRVMIQAYRMLVAKADNELRYAYPLHLGVTEAGDGDEGRIKSAMGIGALLEDGLGDTIRVSLTEDPVHEVPVGFDIVRKYNDFQLVKGEGAHHPVNQMINNGRQAAAEELPPFDPFTYRKRPSMRFTPGGQAIGGDELPRVETEARCPLSSPEELRKEIIDRLALQRPQDDIRTEFVGVRVTTPSDVASLSLLLGSLGADEAARVVASTADLSLFVVLLPMVSRARLDIVEGEMLEKDYLEKLHDSGALLEFCFIHDRSSLNVPAEVLSLLAGKLDAKGLKRLSYSILSSRTVYATRRLILELNKAGIDAPVVVRYRNEGSDRSQILIDSAVQAGTLFCDGIGDIIALQTALSPDDETALAFNILQAARTRMSKTEFISCPGCGRTYFDLESSTKLIKQRIAHLKGLKIGIMGCVVNGPGEMADADFGYVGSGKGHISLYVGKECVEENIEESSALDRLIELIKVNGKWVEPVSAETAPRS